MRVPLSWLGDYVDIAGLEPDVIAEALTGAGLEVESIETVGGRFSGVLVGKIVEIDPHPNADRLRLVTVDLGAGGRNRVVCGAPNVALDMRIPYAQIGATVLSKKDNSLFTLQPAKIRGVESTGMICSLDELDLAEQYTDEHTDGIWPLNAHATDAQLGEDLKTVLGLQAETVLDVAPGANRGDLMSMVGVAREVASLFNRSFTPVQPPAPLPASPDSPVRVQLTDPAVCPFYAGGRLSHVTLAPSPDWMQQRLQHAGIRAINNVVDITNYVMLELGQPLHAFDSDRLSPGTTINVRPARGGETFKTLDDTERSLIEGVSVVVTENDVPVALAGVMGGQGSEITEATRNVFLEAAWFTPASNRRSARSVGLRTESSARFERGVDRGSVQLAFARAIQLFYELAGATLESIVVDDRHPLKPMTVPLSLSHLDRILGLSIPAETVTAILTPLGYTFTADGPDAYNVTVPSFRQPDVSREIDLIEEIIRIYGYGKVPYTLPESPGIPTIAPLSQLLATLQDTLAGAGLTEVSTNSLIGTSLLMRTGFVQDTDTTVAVTNSQSLDHTFLRQSLLPNLIDVLRSNQAEGNTTAWIFELGRGYVASGTPGEKQTGVQEKLMLSGVLAGATQQGQWHGALETDFYTAKGILEQLFAVLGLSKSIRWSALAETTATTYHAGQSARLKLGKAELGLVSRLHPRLEQTLKLRGPVYVFELSVETLFNAISRQAAMTVAPLPAYPAVKRDMAFSAGLEVSHQQVLSAVNQLNEPLLQSIELFDLYQGAQVGEGRRSLAYRLTLQSPAATLTEAEIDGAVDKIKRQLQAQLPVSFR